MRQDISTNQAPQAPNILSQAIRSNGHIFVSGQIHSLPDGSIGGESVAEKLKLIMKNIESILQAAGGSLDSVVKVTVYVTDMAQMPELNKVYPSYFSKPLPAREAICVKELPLGATIELSVIASL